AVIQTYKRSEEYDGVHYEVILNFQFIKDGREFVWAAYEQDAGIDTITTVNIYELWPNAQKKWNLVGTGQINYNKFDLGEVDVVVNIEQTGIERRVLNMKGIVVDLETQESENNSALPPQTVHDVPFHSKKILEKFAGESTEEETEFNFGADSTAYAQFPFETTFDEIETRIDYPIGQSLEEPTSIKKYNWRIKVGGDYKISIPMLAGFLTPIAAVEHGNWTFKFSLVYGKGLVYTTVDIYSETKLVNGAEDVFSILTENAYEDTLSLEIGDEIYLFWSL